MFDRMSNMSNFTAKKTIKKHIKKKVNKHVGWKIVTILVLGSAVAVVPSEKASITSFNIASAACWVLCSPPPLSVKFGCKLTIVAKKKSREKKKKKS